MRSDEMAGREEESGLAAPRRKPLARTQKRNLDESAPFDRSSPLKILAIRSDLRREIVLVLAASPYVCTKEETEEKIETGPFVCGPLVQRPATERKEKKPKKIKRTCMTQGWKASFICCRRMEAAADVTATITTAASSSLLSRLVAAEEEERGGAAFGSGLLLALLPLLSAAGGKTASGKPLATCCSDGFLPLDGVGWSWSVGPLRSDKEGPTTGAGETLLFSFFIIMVVIFFLLLKEITSSSHSAGSARRSILTSSSSVWSSSTLRSSSSRAATSAEWRGGGG